jgi:hypothetical protein
MSNARTIAEQSVLEVTEIRSESTITLTTTPQSVYTGGQNLIDTGTYILQVFLGNTIGGNWYNETWVGLMQWYNAGTNSGDSTEIYMTGMGHASNNRTLHARVLREPSATSNDRAIQLWITGSDTTSNCSIKVKKLM